MQERTIWKNSDPLGDKEEEYRVLEIGVETQNDRAQVRLWHLYH